MQSEPEASKTVDEQTPEQVHAPFVAFDWFSHIFSSTVFFLLQFILVHVFKMSNQDRIHNKK